VELWGVRGSVRGSASGNLNCESICDTCERDVGRKGNVRRNEVRKYGGVKAVKECEGKREWTCKGKVCYTPHFAHMHAPRL
jgi:hypothetical protein